MNAAPHPLSIEHHRLIQGKDHLTFYLNLSRVGGALVRYRVGPREAYLVNHPRGAEQVLARHESLYDNPPHPYAHLAPLLTDEWAFLLRLVPEGGGLPPAQALGRLCERVAESTTALLEGWRRHPVPAIELIHPLKTMMLEAVTRILFDVRVSNQAEAFVSATSLIEECIANQPAFSPFTSLDAPMREQFLAAQRTQAELAGAILRERFASDHPPIAPAHRATLPDAVIRTLLNGYNALAVALGWALHLLAHHPLVLAELQGELARVVGGRVPTSEDIPRLPYSRRVLKETLRLYPPAWMLGRESRAEDVIAGHPIPAGAIFSISPFTLHRQATSWHTPTSFEPRRFDRTYAPPAPPFAFLPFGGGTRICPAAHLSLPLLQIALTLIVQRFGFQSVVQHPVTPRGLISLRPAAGILMQVVARG